MTKRALHRTARTGAVASLASLAACSAILGFDPLTFDPNVGADADVVEAGNSTGVGKGDGAAGPDGSSAIEGGLLDAGTSDADAADAAFDAADAADASCSNDLSIDPLNCGRCGHHCAGAECKASVCQPGKLADALALPRQLVVDGTRVFVAERDVNRIIVLDKNKLPGACNSLLALNNCVFISGQAAAWQPYAMAIDNDNVYWSSSPTSGAGEIRSCPRTSTVCNASKLVTDTPDYGFITDIAVANGALFWAENGISAIRRAGPDGGAPLTLLSNSSYSPYRIAVDNAFVYFTQNENNQPGPTSIWAVPVDGGAPHPVAEAASKTHGITLTAAGDIFFTVPFVSAAGDGVVSQSAKTNDGGLGVGQFADGQTEATAVIADATNVYWLQSGDENTANGKVLYCPIAGCPTAGPILLADQQRNPRHLAQDESAIYWSNYGLTSSVSYDGQVWKIAKP